VRPRKGFSPAALELAKPDLCGGASALFLSMAEAALAVTTLSLPSTDTLSRFCPTAHRRRT